MVAGGWLIVSEHQLGAHLPYSHSGGRNVDPGFLVLSSSASMGPRRGCTLCGNAHFLPWVLSFFRCWALNMVWRREVAEGWQARIKNRWESGGDEQVENPGLPVQTVYTLRSFLLRKRTFAFSSNRPFCLTCFLPATDEPYKALGAKRKLPFSLYICTSLFTSSNDWELGALKFW